MSTIAPDTALHEGPPAARPASSLQKIHSDADSLDADIAKLYSVVRRDDPLGNVLQNASSAMSKGETRDPTPLRVLIVDVGSTTRAFHDASRVVIAHAPYGQVAWNFDSPPHITVLASTVKMKPFRDLLAQQLSAFSVVVTVDVDGDRAPEGERDSQFVRCAKRLVASLSTRHFIAVADSDLPFVQAEVIARCDNALDALRDAAMHLLTQETVSAFERLSHQRRAIELMSLHATDRQENLVFFAALADEQGRYLESLDERHKQIEKRAQELRRTHSKWIERAADGLFVVRDDLPINATREGQSPVRTLVAESQAVVLSIVLAAAVFVSILGVFSHSIFWVIPAVFFSFLSVILAISTAESRRASSLLLDSEDDDAKQRYKDNVANDFLLNLQDRFGQQIALLQGVIARIDYGVEADAQSNENQNMLAQRSLYCTYPLRWDATSRARAADACRVVADTEIQKHLDKLRAARLPSMPNAVADLFSTFRTLPLKWGMVLALIVLPLALIIAKEPDPLSQFVVTQLDWEGWTGLCKNYGNSPVCKWLDLEGTEFAKNSLKAAVLPILLVSFVTVARRRRTKFEELQTAAGRDLRKRLTAAVAQLTKVIARESGKIYRAAYETWFDQVFMNTVRSDGNRVRSEFAQTRQQNKDAAAHYRSAQKEYRELLKRSEDLNQRCQSLFADLLKNTPTVELPQIPPRKRTGFFRWSERAQRRAM
jgi:hypothetical protein